VFLFWNRFSAITANLSLNATNYNKTLKITILNICLPIVTLIFKQIQTVSAELIYYKKNMQKSFR